MVWPIEPGWLEPAPLGRSASHSSGKNVHPRRPRCRKTCRTCPCLPTECQSWFRLAGSIHPFLQIEVDTLVSCRRSFARFCAVFQETLKKIRCRSAAAGGSGHSTSFAFPCRFSGKREEILKNGTETQKSC